MHTEGEGGHEPPPNRRSGPKAPLEGGGGPQHMYPPPLHRGALLSSGGAGGNIYKPPVHTYILRAFGTPLPCNPPPP